MATQLADCLAKMIWKPAAASETLTVVLPGVNRVVACRKKIRAS